LSKIIYSLQIILQKSLSLKGEQIRLPGEDEDRSLIPHIYRSTRIGYLAVLVFVKYWGIKAFFKHCLKKHF